jgi:N-acetyl-gamma-glutamyl-phosphate reductase
MRVSIVNVTGYAGVELARLLLRHPQAQLTQVTGRSAAGQRLSDVFPHLGESGLVIQPALEDAVDVAFLALPHKEAALQAPQLLESGARLIDISADFRLKDAATYEQWYGLTHPTPELLTEAVYGLPELHREAIVKARLIANPGCYPTSAILALAPALGLVEPDIIVDSKSGVSGAGRSLALNTHYCEINENCHAYALGGHRHLPEIVQELELWRARGQKDSQSSLALTFVPHLTPMTRGIISTCYTRLKQTMTTEAVRAVYEDFFRDAPFVRVTSQPPQTKQTWGSNLCLVHPVVDKRTGRLIIISCIDNLVKGAAGQAIQNMNLMFGLEETMGLNNVPVYP